MALSPKVVRFRKYETEKGLLGFFDIIVNDTFVVCENTLLRKKDGKLRWSSASKARKNKDGSPVVIDGYPKWDDYVRLYTERAEGEEKGKPTEAAWEFYNAVLDQASAAFNGDGESQRGRGAGSKAKPAEKATAKAAVGKATEDGAEPDPLDGEDSDLPF